MIAPHLRPLAPTLLAAGALLFAAGCGDDGQTAGSGDATPAASSPAATGTPTVSAENPLDSANALSKTKAKKGDPARLGEREGDPDLPASKGDDLEAARPGEQLVLSSTGDAGRWRISATLEDQAFCVLAATPGASDPTPMCSDQTATGLTLPSSDGGAQVSVSPIRETARGKETKLLVWGVALRAVPEIKVVYAKETKTARLSDGSLTLKVDPATVKALGDEADVKPSVAVRTFAVTFDLLGDAPPTTAVAKPSTPDGGPVTLTLQ